MKLLYIISIIIFFTIQNSFSFINFSYSIDDKETHSHSIQQKIRKLSDGWYEVIGECIINNITPEEAKRLAIQDAYEKAVSYSTGIKINRKVLSVSTSIGSDISIDNFSSVINQTTSGIILDSNVIKESIKERNGLLTKQIYLKVKVGKQVGEKDPSFNITAELNREYFKNGEELNLSVSSSKDCYITIFNICSNDSVYLLLPNQYRKNTFLKSNQILKLPDENDKNIGISFNVNLLPMKEKDREIVKILATKSKINFSSFLSFSAFGTYKTALFDIQNILVNIPRNEIEEFDIQYFIIK